VISRLDRAMVGSKKWAEEYQLLGLPAKAVCQPAQLPAIPPPSQPR
jgi:hypothetical protein